MAQKVLAALLAALSAALSAALLLFSLSFFISTAILNLLVVGEQADPPIEEGAAPQTASPGSSASVEATAPNYTLSISGARWQGERAVVEGAWKGEISSVHCDLLEGGESGKPTRWWDRSVGTQMGWSERIFAQEFVAAEGGEGGEPLDRGAGYAVRCSAQFSSGWQVSDGARVEGTPPG